MGLTEKQVRIVTWVAAYIRDHDGMSPTYEEVADYIGTKSKGNAYSHIERLAERGYLRVTRGHARSMEVLRMPGDPPAEATQRERPDVESANLPRYERLDDALHRHYAMVTGDGEIDATTSKALHWLAIALLLQPSDASAAARLRHLSGTLSNAAQEIGRIGP